jgi:hypothetical protein
VEGTAGGGGGGMVMRVAGDMKMDFCHTQDNVSTESEKGSGGTEGRRKREKAMM